MKQWAHNKYFPFIFVCINLIIQYILLGKYMNSDLTTSLHPFGDSHEYVATTEFWMQSNDFSSTFRSGWRLPGYPAFMVFGYTLAGVLDVAPLLLIKIIQLILLAFIPFFCFKAIYNFSQRNYYAAIFGALIITLYYPFYYFSPLIGAEPVSLFFISILFYQFSLVGRTESGIIALVLIAINIAFLTYLKPNHILFSVPAGILLINRHQFTSREIFKSISKPVILAVFILILMLPWVFFVSSINNVFVPLATTSGEDMIIGTGVQVNQITDVESLTYKYEKKHNLQRDTIYMRNKQGYSLAEKNLAYQKEAIAIWKNRPWITIKYGLVKIAHSLGLSLRNAKDYFSLLVVIPVLLIILLDKKFRATYRNLCLLVVMLILLCWLQTFVYFGDMRLRILMADMPIIFAGSIFIYDFFKKRFFSAV